MTDPEKQALEQVRGDAVAEASRLECMLNLSYDTRAEERAAADKTEARLTKALEMAREDLAAIVWRSNRAHSCVCAALKAEEAPK